ncbi:MAG: hypothetical protein J7K54_04240 [Candidatus Aenigmarchaeota archaeon]|nr:hypothetical protein [Candidatus Aenigmarchaeota archaeon]
MSRILEDRDSIVKRLENGEMFRDILKAEYPGQEIYILRAEGTDGRRYVKSAFFDRDEAARYLRSHEVLSHDYTYLLSGTIEALEQGGIKDQGTEEPLNDADVNMVYFHLRDPVFSEYPPLSAGR